jgi:predicted MFS family arabinose efflux permease
MLRAIVRSHCDAFSGLPREVWVLALVLFVNRVGMMVLPFLELYLAGERGLAVDAAGRLVALYGVGSILGVSLGGRLTDRLGPRRVQLASLVLNALFLMLLSLGRTPLTIGAAILATGLAADAFRPANGTAITAAVGAAARARAFSLMSLAVCVGLTIGLPLGGELAEHDFDWLFRIDAATALLAAAVLWRFGQRRAPPADGVARAAGASDSPWRDGGFLLFVLLQCATATVLFQFFGALPVFLKHDLGFGEAEVGRALALNSILIILFEMQLVRRVEGRPARPLVALGSLGICAGYGLNAFAGGPAMARASIALWSLGEMLFFPLGAALAARRAPPSAVGRYLGVYHLAFALSFVLAPLLGTAVYERHGAPVLWTGCVAVGLLVCALHALLGRWSDP